MDGQTDSQTGRLTDTHTVSRDYWAGRFEAVCMVRDFKRIRPKILTFSQPTLFVLNILIENIFHISFTGRILLSLFLFFSLGFKNILIF